MQINRYFYFVDELIKHLCHDENWSEWHRFDVVITL